MQLCVVNQQTTNHIQQPCVFAHVCVGLVGAAEPPPAETLEHANAERKFYLLMKRLNNSYTNAAQTGELSQHF